MDSIKLLMEKMDLVIAMQNKQLELVIEIQKQYNRLEKKVNSIYHSNEPKQRNSDSPYS